MPLKPHWYQSYESVVEFGAHLVVSGELTTMEELQSYYEKPWKWTPERQAWVEEIEAQSI